MALKKSLFLTHIMCPKQVSRLPCTTRSFREPGWQKPLGHLGAARSIQLPLDVFTWMSSRDSDWARPQQGSWFPTHSFLAPPLPFSISGNGTTIHPTAQAKTPVVITVSSLSSLHSPHALHCKSCQPSIQNTCILNRTVSPWSPPSLAWINPRAPTSFYP